MRPKDITDRRPSHQVAMAGVPQFWGIKLQGKKSETVKIDQDGQFVITLTQVRVREDAFLSMMSSAYAYYR